jgi:hypothetical protein
LLLLVATDETVGNDGTIKTQQRENLTGNVSVSRTRQRRHRNDKAKLVRQYLKKNGRLEGMVRLVDGVHPYEG